MNLSFVILSWNSKAYLERCLDCISKALQGSPLTYEVLVLDNGSKDGTPALLASLVAADPTHVFAHYEQENLGTTRSRNILFARARGEYVCVMDSDVELAPRVVETLLEVLKADPGIGLVAPRVLYPSGRWQKSFDGFPTLLDKANRLLRLRAIEQRQAQQMQDVSQSFPIDYAISAFWLMRRALLEQIGRLDEKIFYAPEDTDFCLRVWQSGRRILYVPTATVVHHTQEISRGFKLNRAKWNHIKGLAYYFLKHRYLLRRPRFAGSGG